MNDTIPTIIASPMPDEWMSVHISGSKSFSITGSTYSNFIYIIRLSAKGTDGVMKLFKTHHPFVLFLCYSPIVGSWHTTEPEEVSGGAV